MLKKYLLCFIRIMLFHIFSGISEFRLIFGASNNERKVETSPRENRSHEKSIEPRETWGSSLSQLHIIEAASQVFLLVEGRAVSAAQ